MSWSDWAVSIALILVVLRQIRGRRLTPLGLLWPVGLVAAAGYEYLGGFPEPTADRLVVLGFAAAGLALGVGCGLLTEVRGTGDSVTARAGTGAAALWVAGMTGRLAFGVVAISGGAGAIGGLSAWLGVRSADTWPTALILMALTEVLARTAVLLVRYRRARVIACTEPNRPGQDRAPARYQTGMRDDC